MKLKSHVYNPVPRSISKTLIILLLILCFEYALVYISFSITVGLKGFFDRQLEQWNLDWNDKLAYKEH